LFLVPTILVYRAIRQHDAIQLLLRHGFVPEASVIGLTQFELCLEVLYVGGDLDRATKWMNHASTRNTPWTVADKINDVWRSDHKMRAAKHAYFEVLSAIKHGNPTAGPFGFPARLTGDHFSTTSGAVDDEWSRTHAILIAAATTYHLVECLEGASRSFARFVALDCSYESKRAELLSQWRDEAGRVAARVGLRKEESLH
jgi:hypothetical protein